MIRHSSVSVASALSPINKSSLEESETKKRELPAARRYCTYELNWNDYNKSGINNKKDAVSMNTYKDTASSSNPPSPQTPPTPHHHQSPQEERMSENLAPSLGGITVTVVQKVEVKANSYPVTKRPAVSKIPRPINSVMQRKGRPVQRRSQILLTRTENDQRPDLFQKINSFDTTSNRQVPPGFRGNVPQNISTSQSKSMVNAPTTNPEDSNDPTDMEDENPSTNIRPIIPPKLLHTALVPLEQYRKYKFVQDTLKKIELSLDNDLNHHHPRRLSRANSKRKKTLLSSQSTKRPSQLFRQRLLEQSVSMSFAGSGLNKSTSIKPEQGAPKDIDPTPDNNCNLRPCQLPRVNSERKKISNSSTNVKQESLLRKGVSMTLTSPDLEKSTSVNFVQDVQNNNNNNYNNYNNNNTNNNNNNSNVNLHPRQLSPGNSRKGGSPISLPSTKRPSQIFRQQLLEQSISMSLNGSRLNNLTEVKPAQNVLKNTTANITPVNDRNLHPRRLSRVNSKRKKSQSVLSPIAKRESQMFRQRLLEQSISMSLDGSSIKPAQNIPRNVIQTHDNNRNLNTRQLSRVNSRRIRSSSSSPSAKRASQIFRQRLLEQSISMSLAGSGSNSLPQSKLPTRRLSRRAKGREAIKERKSEMDNVNPERSDNKCSPKAVNTLPMLRILESEELYQKVNQEIQRQERLKHLRPPPRKVISDSPAPSFIPTSPRPKNNLISSLPERKTPRPLTPRSVTPTSPRPISIDPLPFPTHLSRRSIMRIPHSITLRIAPMF